MKIIPHIQDGGIVLDTKMGEAAEVRFVWAGGWDEEVTLTIDEARALRDQLTALLPAARTPADVLTDPQPGDRVEWEDGEVWTVTGRDTQILHDVTPPDGGGRTYGDRMGLDIWADPMDEGNGSPFVCVPHP